MPMLQRVQKVMAHAGIASRRRCEELIASGRVKVNGKDIKLGDKADPEKDSITVDGNHPYAGKSITFDVKVEKIRDASAEELQHGHAHGAHGHHH